MGHLQAADPTIGLILAIPAFILIFGFAVYFFEKSAPFQFSLIELLSIPFCMIPSFYFCSGNWSSCIGLALIPYQIAGIELGFYWARAEKKREIRVFLLLLGSAAGVALYWLAIFIGFVLVMLFIAK